MTAPQTGQCPLSMDNVRHKLQVLSTVLRDRWYVYIYDTHTTLGKGVGVGVGTEGRERREEN